MRYTIIERIGAGGMAEVFLATAHGPDGFTRPVVLKRILPTLAGSPAFVKMFFDEATLSARLSHPNIVHVYEFGAVGGVQFLAMERVRGRDLRWMMNQLGQRSVISVPAVAVEIARQCCLGLDYAHTLRAPDDGPHLNIIHRDVTPSNIMITSDGVVKLLDFGVARAADEARRTHTRAGVVKGKVAYLSPEQVLQRELDQRADLFSLGVVLHELLTWRRLFQGENDLATVKRVVEMSIPRPSSVNHAVSPALDRIVMHALERDPALRYASASELADDLERFLVQSRYPARIMRRLMRERFEAVWRNSPVPEGGTLLDVGSPDEPSCIGAATPSAPPAATPLPPRTGTRRWPSRRLVWLLATAAVAALLLVASTVRRPPAPPPTAALPAPSAAVSVSIDSMPQGAAVYLDATAPPIGETPLVATLARDRANLVQFTLMRSGYLPATVKVIPDQDKPVLVPLDADTPRPTPPLAGHPRPRRPVPLFTPTLRQSLPSEMAAIHL
jgi:serine/threonine-protein kinase